VETLILIGAICLFILLTYLIVHVFFYFLQGKFIFKPTKDTQLTPDVLDLKFKSYSIPCNKKVDTIQCWDLIPCEQPKATIIFFHGNTGNLSSSLGRLKFFYNLNYRIIAVSYRGFGDSTGDPSAKAFFRDIKDINYFINNTLKLKTEDCIIFGHSLGGASAIKFAEIFSPKALIVEESFTSMVDMARLLHSYLLFIPTLSRHKFLSIKNIKKVNCPSLFIHSKNDDYIPYSMGRELFKASPSKNKKFVAIRGPHSTGWSESLDIYRKEISDFVNNLN